MANDDVIAIDGIATVEIKLNGTSTEIDVYVTRDINGLILGIDWMTKQGPFTFDFPNDRIRFGEGKWLALVKEEKSRMLRRCYVDRDTVLSPTGQTEVDVRITRKGIAESPMQVFWSQRQFRLCQEFMQVEVCYPQNFRTLRCPF